MKVLNNVTIYKCDFCKKELKRKHAMIKHEEICNNNPVNKRPCLSCQNFEMVRIKYEGIGYENMADSKTGHCMLKDILMPHPKTEYKQSVNSIDWVYFEGKEIEQVKMPEKCAEFKGFYTYGPDSHL